ncbi:MAG TPA: hypothetical protein VL049_24215 [Candidatus Dormibacteraeota bacterium]|nr:hypothetical protein [Candidatus Dormibacteraeota bacterium]
MVRARCVLFVAMALAVGGCSAVTDTWNDWLAESPAPEPTPVSAATDQNTEVLYAAVDGLVLHALPSGSSLVVARLTLHQRVTRTGITRGYANVTTDAGLQGWVDNAQLLWRLPAAPAAPAIPTAAAAVATPVPTATP